MMQGNSLQRSMTYPVRALPALVAVITLMLTTLSDARAQSFAVLDSFCAQITCLTGEFPASLMQATNGDLYGTTTAGGSNTNDLCSSVDRAAGCGTVFKITPAGKLTTLYNFCSLPDCADGALPAAPLMQATNGDLYGTTEYGGTHNGGTVFRITPGGKLTTLYNFCTLANCADGNLPMGALVQATNGDLYGTTSGGEVSSPGACTGTGGVACGTVFKITPSGALTTLYSFCTLSDCTDGAFPEAALTRASNGDFYGTTAAAGSTLNASGTVFRLTPAGKLTTLYTFCSVINTYGVCTDGSYPRAPLMQAANGDLYGTTYSGGTSSVGTVFQMTPAGALTTLYNFCTQGYCVDGGYPEGGLIQATNGNFYGTTSQLGFSEVAEAAAGTAFELTPSGVLTILHTFCSTTESCVDGASPNGALVQDTNGDIYGTTEIGGKGEYRGGTIFWVNSDLGPFVALQTNSGEVGEKVEILGTDLTSTSNVTFNGAPATFAVNSIGTAISATVPQGATTGSVEVVTPNGTLQSNVVYRVK
jgi:uncharacterized repeat protein (TIGR03803 family)